MIDENIKIDNLYLEIINKKNINYFFGEWINKIDNLNSKFLNGKPFENIVIDNFLDHDYAEKLSQVFPNNYEKWYKYK